MPFNGKEHKLTREDRSKGGKTVTKTKRLANSLKARKYCNKDCPLWPCTFQPLSEKKYDGKCALKEMPARIQSRYIDLISKGKEGIKKHIVELLNDMWMESNNASFKDKYHLIRSANDFIKTFYGQKLDMSGEIGINANVRKVVTVNEIREALEKNIKKRQSTK